MQTGFDKTNHSAQALNRGRARRASKHHLLWLTRRGRQVWHLQVSLQAEADAHLRYLELADPPTVGFHVRGGDKLDEDRNGASASSSSQAFPLSMQQSSFSCQEPWQRNEYLIQPASSNSGSPTVTCLSSSCKPNLNI